MGGSLAGEALARLHRELAKSRAPVDRVDLLDTVTSWALPVCRKLLSLPSAFCEAYLREISELFPCLPVQTVHRDPNPAMFLESGDSLTLAHSPLTERNARLYDPCCAAAAILSETFGPGETPERLQKWLAVSRALLTAYAREARLTDAERRAVPHVLLANQLICAAWFREQDPASGLCNVNKRMTRWLISISKLPDLAP